MGYRSDVGIALAFKTETECDAFIVAYKIREPEFWREMIAGAWGRAGGRVLVGRYEEVKWYRGLEDVDAVHEMLDWAVGHCDAAYRFVRAGENPEDVEVDMDGGEDWDTDSEVFLYECVDVRRVVDVTEGTPLD